MSGKLHQQIYYNNNIYSRNKYINIYVFIDWDSVTVIRKRPADRAKVTRSESAVNSARRVSKQGVGDRFIAATVLLFKFKKEDENMNIYDKIVFIIY